MTEIKINLSKLENAITRLQVLEKNWSANDTTPPATVGGGQTVNELEELSRIYKELNTNMVALASNTVGFLSGVRDSYRESDQKAASGISGS